MPTQRPIWKVIAASLTVAGLVYVALVWTGLAPYAPPVTAEYGPMGDSRGYWNAWEGGLYDLPWLTHEAYVYSPAFAQVTWPLTVLPWPVWAISWTLASIIVLFWLRVPYLIAFPPVLDDLLRGNVHIFMAAAIVLGLRWPGWWAFLLLTKVTPGIGLAWFAIRRDWAALSIGVGVTASIVIVSTVLTPGPWFEWIMTLATLPPTAGEAAHGITHPALRIPAALVILGFAAWTNRPWLVPFAVLLALPIIWLWNSLSLLAAVPRLSTTRLLPGTMPSRHRSVRGATRDVDDRAE